MNPPKADELDYIHFLIAAQKIFTCTETTRRQPNHLDPPARDALTRLPEQRTSRHGGLVGGDENVGRTRARIVGGGRHHFGQALLQESTNGEG